MHRSWGVLLLLILGISHLAACSKGTLSIDDAWIPEAPPNLPALAGYMTINNDTDDIAELVEISANAFERIEIHNTVHNKKSGLVSMIRQHSLNVAPHTSMQLKPGGYHLMLVHPRITLQDGEPVPLTFLFSNGQRLDVQFQIRRD